VVTSGGERLRFESFSVCCGVYARADFNPEGIDGDWIGRGTTNVDFNPPMRAALSGVLDREPISVNVGADRVELEHGQGSTIEKKVKLPVRWLKGFVEVQVYQSKMKPIAEISGAEARRFLASLPKQETWSKGSFSFAVPAGKGLRLSQRQAPNGVAIGAPGRLRALEAVARHAKSMRVYGHDEVSAWEFVLDGASLHVVISPDASRGFSGEGQALTQLANSRGEEIITRVRSTLQWQSKLDPSHLCKSLNSDDNTIDAALNMLGARGLVGFDVSEGKYFHRELPFDMELVDELQPRLQAARELCSQNKVRIAKQATPQIEAYVQGTETEHRVVLSETDATCTCRWFSKYQGSRGACKHVLAVQMLTEEAE
jgi:hypothetical protein